MWGRSPQGECGLKYQIGQVTIAHHRSLPARGVWIEIRTCATSSPGCLLSLPARGVWIEISDRYEDIIDIKVAPRKGSVD